MLKQSLVSPMRPKTDPKPDAKLNIASRVEPDLRFCLHLSRMSQPTQNRPEPTQNRLSFGSVPDGSGSVETEFWKVGSGFSSMHENLEPTFKNPVGSGSVLGWFWVSSRRF